ncbi:TPA: hypothetical protein ACKRVM_005575, partial [Pseudomonas aeruginosa]
FPSVLSTALSTKKVAQWLLDCEAEWSEYFLPLPLSKQRFSTGSLIVQTFTKPSRYKLTFPPYA